MPKIPKLDINEIRKLLGLGSQTAPALIDDVAEEAGPLVNRLSSEATEVAPKVIGKGPRYADDVAEAADAQFTDMPPINATDDVAKRMNPSLGKIATALGLVTAGGAIVGSGGGKGNPPTPPVAKPSPVAPSPEGMEESIASAGKSRTMSNGVIPTQEDTESDLVPAHQREEPDFNKMLREAQDESRGEHRKARLIRASEDIAAGLARLPANYGSSDLIREGADQSIKHVKDEFNTYKEQQSFNKAQAELSDENKMRDPNSEVSKLTSELAIKAGLIKPGTKMSAMALKSSGVNLGVLLSTIEAGKARAEAAKLARETRSEDTKLKLDAKSNEEALKREDKRKLTTEEIEDRRRNIMDNINLVKQAVQDKGTTELIGPHNENVQRMIDAIAVDMAKLADPNSVARPSEVEMFKRGLFSTGTEGMKLSNKSALDIMDKFTSEVDRRAANAYKVRNISPNNAPTPTPGSSPESVQPIDNNFEKARTVKMIAPNGSIKMIPVDQVEAALKAGGKLAQ